MSKPLTEKDWDVLRYQYDAVLTLLHVARGRRFTEYAWNQVCNYGGKACMVEYLVDSDVPAGFDVFNAHTWPSLDPKARELVD